MVREVSAGPTHEHEMCNMYVMTYSPIPHIEMCADGNMMASGAHDSPLSPPPTPRAAGSGDGNTAASDARDSPPCC